MTPEEKKLVEYLKENPIEVKNGRSSDRLISIIEKQERMLERVKSWSKNITQPEDFEFLLSELEEMER